MSKLKLGIYGIVGIFVLYNIFFGKSDSETVDYYEETITEPGTGLITEVKEVAENSYKITNEESVPLMEDSRIIATFLSGEVDTFTLDEARLVYEQSGRNGMRTAMMGGLMGYYMGKSMSAAPDPNAYADKNTYSKVQNNAGNDLKSNAKTRTVIKPKSGFGSGKSARSYGG